GRAGSERRRPRRAVVAVRAADIEGDVGATGGDEMGGHEEDAAIVGQIRVVRREGATLVEDELDPVRAIGCGRQVARANGGRAYEVGKTSRGVRDVTTGDRHIRPRREVVDAVEEDVD